MGVQYKNNAATQRLKKAFGSSLRLPGNVQFILENNERDCRIILNPQKVQTENMQTNANAFEAWAVALHIALNESGMIILDVDGEFAPMEYGKNGHWGRFLYRALRFSEQYEWFILSYKVKVQVKKFKAYMNSNVFTNNPPKGNAGIKEKHNNENAVEAMFVENIEFQKRFDFLAGNAVYRQLPVGLFRVTDDISEKRKTYKYSYGEKTKIFTGKHSAIDLWTWDEDKFKVIELKNQNVMVGIITEIFFYTNYMYDFLASGKKQFVLNKYADFSEPENDRGYKNIYELWEKRGFKKIQGIMLADEYHPILNHQKVLEVLNKCNLAGDIEYVKAEYKL